MSLYLQNTVLELLKSIYVCHGCWWRVGAFKRGLVSKTKKSANDGWKRERERDNERLRGIFYHDPMVGAKCIYENLKLAHVKVDVAKVGSWISHVGLRVTFVRRTRRGTCKIKDFDAQVSIWVRRIREKTCIQEYASRCVYVLELRVLVCRDRYSPCK